MGSEREADFYGSYLPLLVFKGGKPDTNNLRGQAY